MFPVPPLFNLIRDQSSTSWEEMYKVFNMGHRMEIYTDEKTAAGIISISDKFKIEAKIIGRCESYEGKKLTIQTSEGTFTYM
jgi:phosphoribosylformylglycinamidine cyclo-ligase